jgi:hypothetical protein
MNYVYFLYVQVELFIVVWFSRESIEIYSIDQSCIQPPYPEPENSYICITTVVQVITLDT